MTRDLGTLRRTLTARLTELGEHVARIEEEQRRPLDDDFAEQAIDREDDQPLDAIEHSALAEIAATRLALARLDAGTYGICTACGNAILPARLEAMPSAALCIDCAAST